jgi:hypothetical protein
LGQKSTANKLLLAKVVKEQSFIMGKSTCFSLKKQEHPIFLKNIGCSKIQPTK